MVCYKSSYLVVEFLLKNVLAFTYRVGPHRKSGLLARRLVGWCTAEDLALARTVVHSGDVFFLLVKEIGNLVSGNLVKFAQFS